MSPGAEDAVLVRAAQNGDVGSLGVLLERHRARLLAIAVGILGHGPQAEDAVQDACLTAVSRIGDLRDPTAARAWLATIVTNACRARLRRRPIQTAAETDEPLTGAGADSVERAIEQLALRDWVWTALERLSEPLRLVVVLRYFTAANSYAAIAELCGVPVGTVRSRLNAARAKLADELLQTAAQTHLSADDAHARYSAQIGAAMYRFGRDGDRRVLDEVFAADLEFVMFDRIERRGLDTFAELLSRDFDDGVTVRPIRAVASSDVTVLEAWLDSPPESPLHCPPALTQVYHHAGGRARRVVSHYAPREPS
jgi:RNA polymerase sigma factor (sigma-70 family)